MRCATAPLAPCAKAAAADAAKRRTEAEAFTKVFMVFKRVQKSVRGGSPTVREGVAEMMNDECGMKGSMPLNIHHSSFLIPHSFTPSLTVGLPPLVLSVAQALELRGERRLETLQRLGLGLRVRFVVEREVCEAEVEVRLGVVGFDLDGA